MLISAIQKSSLFLRNYIPFGSHLETSGGYSCSQLELIPKFIATSVGSIAIALNILTEKKMFLKVGGFFPDHRIKLKTSFPHQL